MATAIFRSRLRTVKEYHEKVQYIHFNPHGAAARLGMKRSTLYFRMRKLGISRRGSKE